LYFYLCIGLLLVWSRRRAGLALTAAALLVVALNAYWYANGMYHPDQQPEVGMLQAFFAFPLTLEFIAGFLLSEYLRDRPRPSPYPWLIGAAVFLGLAFGYHSYANLYPSGLSGFFHAPERSVLLGGLGCCLVAAAVALEKRGIAPWPWLQRLGDMSYSIYLSHILMIAMTGFILEKLLRGSTYMAPLGVVASIGATLLASWWTYRWLERPLYALLKSGLSRPARLWQQALPNKSP
jgi:peptidoglycan/LPS O-acetylase OafA/YrhL